MLPEPKRNMLDIEELDAKLERAFARNKRKAAESEKGGRKEIRSGTLS